MAMLGAGQNGLYALGESPVAVLSEAIASQMNAPARLLASASKGVGFEQCSA